MLGRNRGVVPNPMETLAPQLEARGYDCLLTSRLMSLPLRLLDKLATLLFMRGRIDVVCLQIYSFRSFIAEDAVSWLARFLRLPTVMVLHGGAIPAFMSHRPRWFRRVLRRACLVIAPSPYLADAARAAGFRPEVIPNLIDLDRYPFVPRRVVRPRLLWMRAFHEVYNPWMAIDVLEELLKTHPDASLTMAGQEKGLLGPLRREVARRGLNEHVRFVGFLDMNGKRREFPDHDIFLNTTHVDNMPVGLIESAAFGVPIVSTNVGGIPHLLKHQETGLLVGDGDAAGMAAAVRSLLADPNLAEQLSRNGRAVAEQCRAERVVPMWERLFQRAHFDKRGGNVVRDMRDSAQEQ